MAVVEKGMKRFRTDHTRVDILTKLENSNRKGQDTPFTKNEKQAGKRHTSITKKYSSGSPLQVRPDNGNGCYRTRLMTAVGMVAF